MLGIELGWPHAEQISYPQYCHSTPATAITFSHTVDTWDLTRASLSHATLP